MDEIEGQEADEPVARSRSWTRVDTWALTAIAAVAALLRLIRLDDPKVLVFDETYYAKDACWYVLSSPGLCDVDSEVTMVHPPAAKWLLAIGIRLFGYDTFGWRVAAAVAGIVTIALLYLLARRLLRSTTGAVIASSLLAVDFLHFVESRIAMLDIFVPAFGIAGILFLVYDRDDLFAQREPAGAIPGLLRRPWRIAAGAAGGLAMASKWSGGFFIVLILVLAVVWEWRARRESAEPRPALWVLRHHAASLALWLVVFPLIVYSFTYIGRLPGPDDGCPERDGIWVNRLYEQQKCMLSFHKDLSSDHSYQSPAWSWPLLKRPVSYYFETDPNGDYKEVFAAGSPFVWWVSFLALMFIAFRWIRRRDPLGPEGVILAGFVFTYVPWLIAEFFSDRSAVFLFYLLPTVPFMCLALAFVGANIGRSWEAKAAIGIFLAAALGFFVFYYPLLAKVPIPRDQWERRIWVFDDCDKPKVEPSTSLVTETKRKSTVIRTSLITGSDDDLPPEGWCWI